MNQGCTPLARIRRSRRVLLGVLVAFVATSAAHAASPCAAMGVAGEPAAPRHASHDAGHAASTPRHVSATMQHGVHPRCPHCPPGADPAHGSAAHLQCASLDDLTDTGAEHIVPKWELKHVPPLATAQAPMVPAAAVRDGRIVDRYRLRAPPVPIRLRYGVLTI